ncbi:MAG TPA: alcohol dehydrogenase catalytic domain-containing protein [Alphaproteobacteria bacterium]|nr:alcohol dehydrogenase catalytic domain-containing protein [Alphaproteobacteria bacterium]
MKALVYTKPLEVTYRDEPNPAVLPGEALVRVDAVGICGSDMHGYHGHDPRRVPPLVLGHEAAGEVIAGAAKGRRVVLNPLVTCGLCDYCLGGRANLCPERKLIGMNRQGAFAELIAMPEENLIEAPAGMSATAAAVTEPAATALHAVHLGVRALARPLSEGKTLVLGGGSVGLLSALWAQAMGGRRVLLGETNALRRSSVKDAGVEAYDPVATQPDPNGFDLVIDAVGASATRQAAIRSVKPGGVIVHIGLMDSAGAADWRKITLQEVTLIGTYTYTAVDLTASAAALHEGRLGKLAWVEERPLSDGARAFADLDHGRTAAAKIVLRP